MLEKAKNRKIFLFFVFIILVINLCIFSVTAGCNYEKEYITSDYGVNNNENWDLDRFYYNKTATPYPQTIYWERTSTGHIYGSGGSSGLFTCAYGSGTWHIHGGAGDNCEWNFETWNYSSTPSGCTAIPITYSGAYPYVAAWDRIAPVTCGIFNYRYGNYYEDDAHRYTVPGTWTVTYCDSGGYVSCDVDVNPSSGASPLAVTFTDKSSGFTEGVTPVYLDYGDGNSFSGLYGGYDSSRNYIYLDAGTYNYSYRLYEDGSYYYDNGTVTVTGDSTVNFAVYVHALNGSVIGDATVNIWYDGGSVTDSELTDDFYGTADFYVEPSRYVNGNVTKTGYYTSNFTYYVCPTGYCSNEQWITLYTLNETPGTGDEFGNYLVTFKNAVTGDTVSYSNIEIYSDSGYTTLFYDEYSNAAGVWTGLVPMNVTYYYKYPETTGYYSQSWSYNLTSSPSYKTVNLVPKTSPTTTVTPTPTTTTTITISPTYTYNNENLSSLNVKERMTNLLVLAGFSNAESADLIFAMIIVLGCTCILGWITLSGSGAGIGAIIGFVFSLGLGLLPLWLLIAALFLGGIYLALKLFGGTGE